MINETHVPTLRSWVPGSDAPGGEFPIQNLPFGAFEPAGGGGVRLGVAIGDSVLDLRGLVDTGLLNELGETARWACQQPSLNRLAGLGSQVWHPLRLSLSRLLRAGASRIEQVAPLLHPRGTVRMALPIEIGDYTDFYTSIHHATNAGRLFRPDSPLFPNFEYLPVAYHGRASSVVVSGEPCRRPSGQVLPAPGGAPVFRPTSKLDYELELGCIVGPGNRLGDPVPIGCSEDHLFGLCLLNDWSARDIQAWEYQPLGPFLGKSFMTTISPWVVTLEALAPFRKASDNSLRRVPVPRYLDDKEIASRGALDIELTVSIETAAMRAQGLPATPLGRAPFVGQYWTVFQMLTHHASNGCNLRPGDLFGTGTISGAGAGEEGCLLEKTSNGTRPVELPTGEKRGFLEDDDEIVMEGRCVREGFVSIGFGECRGRVEAALGMDG